MSNFCIDGVKRDSETNELMLWVNPGIKSTAGWITSDKVKEFLRRGGTITGVTLKEDVNPIFTADGMDINPSYTDNVAFIGKWAVVCLRKGDYAYTKTFNNVLDKDTIYFFDTSVDWDKDKYPLGQFVASYFVSTLMNHHGKLRLQADIPSWTVSELEMIEVAKKWYPEEFWDRLTDREADLV